MIIIKFDEKEVILADKNGEELILPQDPNNPYDYDIIKAIWEPIEYITD